MGFFSSASSSTDAVSTQTNSQMIMTEELMAKAMEAIRGFRPDTRSRHAGPTGAQQNLFSAVNKKAAQAGGGKGSRAQRAQRSAGPGPGGSSGPKQRTGPKDEMLQGLNALIGKIIKNDQF